MELKGKLNEVSLPEVLQFIEQREHTGYLELRLDFADNNYARLLAGDFLEERIIVRNGQLHGLAFLNAPDTWCRYMVRADLVPRNEEKSLHDRLEGLGDIFLQALAGVLEADGTPLRDRVEFILTERAGWLFLADAGEFQFEFDDPPQPLPGWNSISLADFIQRGTECADIMRAFFQACPDPDASVSIVPIPDDAPPPPAITAEEWGILRRVNGRKTVLHFLRESRLPIHLTVANLLGLMREGYLRIGAGSEEQDDAESPDDSATEESPRRKGSLRRMFQGSRGGAVPDDPVGRMCLLVNRFIDQSGAVKRSFRDTWNDICRNRPLASALAPCEDGFQPGEFATTLEAWGNHKQDWADVEHETREALEALMSRMYRDLFLKEGKKRADSVLRRVLQELPEGEGTDSIARLGETLPAA